MASNGDLSDPRKFDYVASTFRKFFASRGLVEFHPQSRLSILSACEQPETLTKIQYRDVEWPLPQSQQLLSESVLLSGPEDIKGYYWTCTSYRNEPSPIEGRHALIFPMLEIEHRGDYNTLHSTLNDLLLHFGYSPPSSSDKESSLFPEITYEDMCKHFHTEELTHVHEEEMAKILGPAYFITHFPERTSPFFNMKRNSDGTAKKIDVILSGKETIGSAERSCDVSQMRENFHTISDGKYASTLYDHFGIARVEKELEDYFSLNFAERFGFGLGVTRLIASLDKEGLFPF